MLGSVRWNVVLGAVGMVLTFAFSLGNNGIAISCLRSLYAFAAMFAAGYLLRGALHIIVGSAGTAPLQEPDHVGTRVDLQTPEEEGGLNDLLKAQLEAGTDASRTQTQDADFVPFQPARVFKAEGADGEELAAAVRRLAQDEEE